MNNLKGLDNWAMLCLSPSKGGLEMVAANTVKSIPKFSFVIALEPSWIIDSLKGSDKITYIVSKPKLTIFPWVLAYEITDWILKHKITLLHIHWTKDLALSVLIKKMLSKKGYYLKLVVSRHMGISHSKNDPYHKWLYTSVDTYICVCNFVYQQATLNLPVPIERIYINYPGVEPVQQEANLPFNLDENKINFVVLGRIEQGKGQHLMIKAISYLSAKDVHCYFIGHAMNENYLNELKSLATHLNVATNITFCGFLAKPAQYLSHFDALILTTYCETFGIVLIEAMRAGIMVAGSNKGGVVEIIEHERSGLLFESGDSTDLSSKLEWIVNNTEESQRIALDGKKRADKLFAKNKNFHALEKILSDYSA